MKKDRLKIFKEKRRGYRSFDAGFAQHSWFVDKLRGDDPIISHFAAATTTHCQHLHLH